ncbi:hypothetical protein B1748_27220 [Paenibacillus sp. MY03]|nr:hypothetical protein B1748_27220 [Paenibacillus sp. MY03]
MSIKTLVVAPYAGLAELTNSLKADLEEFDITVIQGDLSEVLPQIDSFHLQGYDLIISRGGTATLLSKHSYLPVIDIQVSGFDILRMLTLVKGFQAPVEMIGFRNVIEGIISGSNLMDMDISYTVIHHQDEVDQALQAAKSKGVKVIVGDNITVKKATGHGMQGVLITSGPESVKAAFTQAKQIYKISQTYKVKNQAFETLLSTMETGYAIVDQEGTVKYANQAFRDLLKLKESQSNLFRSYPYLQKLLVNLGQGITLDHQMMMVDQEGQFALTGDEIPMESDLKVYYLKARPAAQAADADIHFGYSAGLNHTFPPLIMTQAVYSKEKASYTLPMAVYGEEGAGRRLFVLGSLMDHSKTMVEIKIFKSAEASFRALLALISICNEDQILYISGAENLTLTAQEEFAIALEKVAAKTVFSFLEDPVFMLEQTQIDKKLYNFFKKQIVYIAPLHERREDLEEYIRAFLISFNEKYGKQIVGVRPEVIEALHDHSWANNLFELKDVMEQFVQHTSSEYIDTNVLPILYGLQQNQKNKGSLDPELTGLNLNQTLDHIEKDIIQIVLEQEGMNQSHAANRLGINRSTLWRKLKG